MKVHKIKITVVTGNVIYTYSMNMIQYDIVTCSIIMWYGIYVKYNIR